MISNYEDRLPIEDKLGVVLTSVVAIVLGKLLADLVMLWVNPRVKLE